MEVRAYYATTVQAAIETAKRELGPDAMLVHSRRSPAETAHLGRYEVVFAGEVAEIAAPEHSAVELRQPQADFGDTDYLEPLDLVSGRPDFSAILEIPGATLKEARPLAGDPQISELRREIRCKPGLGRSLSSAASVVALVGPPGSGKTTTLMKLAMRYGLMAEKDLRILSIDHLRIGAAEPLRRFAEVLSVEFHQFDSLVEFSRVMRIPRTGLTLIDTAGFSRSQAADLGRLAECIQEHSAIETQLVLNVDRKTADNLTAIKNFAPFAAERLILTGLDETSEWKEIRTILARADTPVSFLGIGPQVPEGLEAARSARLAELILFGWPAARAA